MLNVSKNEMDTDAIVNLDTKNVALLVLISMNVQAGAHA